MRPAKLNMISTKQSFHFERCTWENYTNVLSCKTQLAPDHTVKIKTANVGYYYRPWTSKTQMLMSLLFVVCIVIFTTMSRDVMRLRHVLSGLGSISSVAQFYFQLVNRVPKEPV